MAAQVHPAPDDAFHRALAAVWHAVQVTARAIARFTKGVAKWCRGEDACGDDEKHLCRSERKRLRKAKLRQLQATKKAA